MGQCTSSDSAKTAAVTKSGDPVPIYVVPKPSTGAKICAEVPVGSHVVDFHVDATTSGAAATVAGVAAPIAATTPVAPSVSLTYLISVAVFDARLGEVAAGGELWVTASAGGVCASARLADGGTPRLDLALATQPSSVHVELVRRTGDQPAHFGGADVSLTSEAGTLQASPHRVAPSLWLTLTDDESNCARAVELNVQITCTAMSSLGAGEHAKLAYASSVGLTTVRLEAVQTTRGLMKRIAAVVGARAARDGKYTLRVALMHGLRAFTSHGFAPTPPDVDAADVRNAAAGAAETPTILVGHQDCRIWIRAQETLYVCPIELFVEAPQSRHRYFSHLPHMPHALGGSHVDSLALESPSIPRPRLVLIARGYLDTAPLQNGIAHAFNVTLTTAGRGTGVSKVADLTDAGEVVLLREMHRRDVRDKINTAAGDSPTVAASGAGGVATSPALPPPHIVIPIEVDSGISLGHESSTPNIAEIDEVSPRLDGDEVGSSRGTSGSPVDEEGFGFNSPGVHTRFGGDGIVFQDHFARSTPIPHMGSGEVTPALGIPTAAAAIKADVLGDVPEAVDAYALDGARIPSTEWSNAGVLKVRAIFQPKAQVESWFFSQLLQQFDANGNGSLDASEVTALLELLGTNMNEEDMAALVARIDTDGDGVLRVEELLSWMRSADFQSLPVGYALLSVLARGEHGLDSVVNDISDITRPAAKSSAAGAGVALICDPSGHTIRDELGLYCIDRETGLVVNEFIPKYVRLALKLMYSSQLGRSAVAFTSIKTVLRRISAREGCVNKPTPLGLRPRCLHLHLYHHRLPRHSQGPHELAAKRASHCCLCARLQYRPQ